jgi:hypothetical protein
MNRLFYAIHKWISAAAFVQLAIWTVSGFLFTWISQDSIKSAPVAGAHVAPIADAPPISVARAIEAASQAAGAIEKVELRGTPSGAFYLVRGATGAVRVDARTGAVAPVGREEAEAIARRDQPNAPEVKDATLVSDAPPIEYRDCEHGDCTLPAWRVALADRDGTAIWIDATTGEVTARRNDAWRTYDFFWSLHIMDYRGREDFNHLLIRAAALLAMATVLSGIVLLAIRAARWTKKKLSSGAAATTFARRPARSEFGTPGSGASAKTQSG